MQHGCLYWVLLLGEGTSINDQKAECFMKQTKFKEGDKVRIKKDAQDYRVKGKEGEFIVVEVIIRSKGWIQYEIERVDNSDDWERVDEGDLESVEK